MKAYRKGVGYRKTNELQEKKIKTIEIYTLDKREKESDNKKQKEFDI